MSETVRYKGRVKRVDIVPREVEGYLISKMSEREINDYQRHMKDGVLFDNNEELLSWYDELNEKYFIINGWLYEFISKSREETEYEFFEAIKNDDGTIDFHVMYYNGGCCLSEAVDEAIERITK